MPSIEFGPKGPHAARAVGAVDVKKLPSKPVGNDRAAQVANEHSAVVRSRELDPGQPPVDAERVQVIRKAIEDGTYPIVPAKVADAIIAAGLLLRTGK
ncbi:MULTISPECIES: flagellar biosynthesis anti-sigma factor FlgM [unclassified Novosphingobium]|uniref:flagellar biosynthesis anti-sigma factor FlgM n=1 Tax=unclassified Novosphingobium TaxID=2644732 RepID=UPI000EE4627C|nr:MULTISPECIES: flagellar biosynthesis anti-sigma factor FlgM [unclassified Novosphingobium]HCF24473.1 flagellar biosynthesis anti-sigma factor FlgM [Novosphingobium sp.]HQV03810.1 flagellar biosynthesis anti-sigma factor FlgM [Novosphingobium sp.]